MPIFNFGDVIKQKSAAIMEKSAIFKFYFWKTVEKDQFHMITKLHAYTIILWEVTMGGGHIDPHGL